jgi:hypothetical protein
MTIKTFLFILMTLESSVNPNAIGDDGNAVGAFQIWNCVIEDVNKLYGTSYRPEDRTDKNKSARICFLYLSHYGSKERLGREPRVQDWARIWNGGPNGHRKQATKKYWDKFTRIAINITKEQNAK